MTKEEAERRAAQGRGSGQVNAHNNLRRQHLRSKPSTDSNAQAELHSPRNDAEVEKTLSEAEKYTDKQTGKEGRRKSEEEKGDRTLGTLATDGRMSTTLPIVQEAGENSSHHGSQRGDETPDQRNSQAQEVEHRTVEYAVIDDDHHFCGGADKHKEHVEAPLGDQGVEDDCPSASKPPRLESGIIPTITPLYREDEIGIAK